jgi:hypothetical protein
LLFPLWVQYWNVWDIFFWAKTISLIPIAVIWCSVLHLGINNDCWTQWGTFAVLSTNILEAVIIKDALPKPRRRDMDSTECFQWCFLILSELPTWYAAQIVGWMQDFVWEQVWIFGDSDKCAPQSTSSWSLCILMCTLW